MTATKTEKPILFSTELVQAILDGRKTQTRRVIKPQPKVNKVGNFCYNGEMYPHDTQGNHVFRHFINDHSPYGKPGDELWVRETWKPLGQDPGNRRWNIKFKTGEKVGMGRLWPPEKEHKEIDLSERLAEQLANKGCPFDEDTGAFQNVEEYMPWRPSIHMPRGASRIQLTVEDIRVERVQEIDGMEAFAEGIGEELPIANNGPVLREKYRNEFSELWDSINADRGYSWESNPWVWVVEFSIKNIKGA